MENIYHLLGLERPLGLIGEPSPTASQNLSFLLPRKAQESRCELWDITYRKPESMAADPVILFDRKGRILHQWPDDYVPGVLEIERVCLKLKLA